MTRAKTRYSSGALASLGVSLVVMEGFYPTLQIPLPYGHSGAWLLLLMTGVLLAAVIYPVAAALAARPSGNLIGLVQSLTGRAGGILYALAVLGMTVFGGAMILRETSEMAISAVYPHTPLTFATTAILLGAVYIGVGDDSSIVQIGRLFLPALLLALLLFVLGTVGWGEFSFLRPFWGSGPLRMLMGVPSTAMLFAPVLVLLLIAGGVSDRHRLSRWLPLVPLCAGAVFAVVKANLLMIFPYPLGRETIFPLHAAARLIIGGRFFERVEGVWVFLWVMGTIILVGALLHATAAGVSQAFGIPRAQTLVWPIGAMLLTFAFLPPDQATAIAWHTGLAPLTALIALLLPAAVGLLSLLMHRRRSA